MKHLHIATATAVVLSLAACSQKIDFNEPAENSTFEITAAVAGDTKTAVADDWSVTWSENDALSAVINSMTKVKFTYNGDNKFTTTDFGAVEGTDYTWNFLYCTPYTDFTGIQNDYSQNYINIPAKTNEQASGNDKAHLGNQPLYGYVAKTTGTERPTVAMKHLTTVIAVELTNTGSETIDIKSVNVANDAEKDMSGTFYVNCADGTVKSSSNAAKVYTYPYSSITLTDGKLAANATATYYVPSAAFSLEAGNKITISFVDAEGQMAEVEKQMTSATTFTAGKIKTTKISLSSADFGEAIAKIANIKIGDACTVQGTVVAKYTRGDIISDGTGSVLLYMDKETSYKIGDVLKVKGIVKTFNKGLQFDKSATITSVGTTAVTYPEPINIDATEAEKYIVLDNAYCKYASITGTLKILNNYYNVVIDGTQNAQGSIAFPTAAQKTALEALNGKSITVKGYVFSISGKKYINIVMTEVIFDGVEISSISGETSWEYDKTDAHTLTVEGINLEGKTITVSGDSHFIVSVNGTTLTVTPSSALSETDDTVSETITVAVEGGNSKTIALTHNKKASSTAAWTLVTDASTLKAGDKIVIASNSKGFVATSTISSTYITNVKATFSTDTDKTKITDLPDNAGVFTLGGEKDKWTLTCDDNNKLLGTSAAKTMVWDSGTTTWLINIDENNNATIQSTTSGYGRILYNVGNPRFATYTSNLSQSMLLPQIYKYTE